MKQFFVTSTGTNIGKTFVIEKLCQNLISDGKKFDVIKPVISGFEDDDLNSDTVILLRVLQKQKDEKNIDDRSPLKIPQKRQFLEAADISPWRFKAPLSPNIAAALEGKKINFSELVLFCQNRIKQAKKFNQHLFIEGAGGVMTPIAGNKTFLDLISELKIPVILVIGDYLGTISHTLTAITVLKIHKIKIDRIVFNCRNVDDNFSGEVLRTLKIFTKIHIYDNLNL